MKSKIAYGAMVILMLLLGPRALAQKVTISNNLLYDATLTPNLRLGVRLSPHWSLGVTGGYRPWPSDDDRSRKWKHMLVSPDLRYWTDSVNVHHFFGMNLIYSHYNISGIKIPFGLYHYDEDVRRQGDFGGIGAFYGYSWPLGRHWNFEALIGAAVGYTEFDRYACGHCGKKLGDGKKVLVLPQAALNIVYNIPGRPRAVEPVEPVIPTLPTQPTDPTGNVAEAPTYVPTTTPVLPNTAHLAQLERENPVLAPASEYQPYDHTKALRKDKGALFVYYPVAKYKLQENYRDNAATLQRIIAVTRQIMEDSTCEVSKIQIVGFASVEGGQWGNERLALRRANSLKDYVQQRVKIDDSRFDVASVGEAWADLRDYVADLQSGAVKSKWLPVAKPTKADYQKALDIMDKEKNPVRREQRLRALNGGRTWRYIRQVFSEHRNAGYVRIFYDKVPDTNAETINKASQLLSGGQYTEALSLLNQVRTDKRAQNALGVALWQTGKKQEALDCFRRAAADGNADAAENLRQLSSQVK